MRGEMHVLRADKQARRLLELPVGRERHPKCREVYAQFGFDGAHDVSLFRSGRKMRETGFLKIANTNETPPQTDELYGAELSGGGGR